MLNYSNFSKEGAQRPVIKERPIENERKYSKMDLSVDHERIPHKRSIDSLNYDDTYKDLINNDPESEK